MLAAQIATIKALMLRGAPEDLRVSFLLLDSTVETLMVRAIDYEILANGLTEESAFSRYDAVAIDLRDVNQLNKARDLGPWNYLNLQLSKTQVAQIDRNFTSKIQMLIWLGLVPSEFEVIVNRLHDYRNEIYHRDHIRDGALRATVQLYALVTAKFLAWLPPRYMGNSGDTAAAVNDIKERLATEAPAALDPSLANVTDMFKLQELMAAHLVAGVAEEARSIPGLLASLVQQRLELVRDLLADMSSFFSGREPNSEMDIIRMLYSDDPFETTEARLRRKIPVTHKVLARWDLFPEQIEREVDEMAAFAALAKFEDEFENFENLVMEAHRAMEQEVDRQIEDWKLNR
ncbi:MAG: hypothetical protein JWR04_805 [Rhodoglobus sp.]|nr:hypothetical protein [Rhodoglobus sp.]